MNQQKVQVPSVYVYTNYRLYLADFYQARKQSKRGYSFRQFSQIAGFRSPNLLKLVIEGQRNLTPQSIEKFILALQLSGSEAEYFRVLVALNQADSDSERQICYEKLQKIIPQSRRYVLDAEAAEYLSHWIYPVIRELVERPDFREDPYWIQRRLTGRIDLKEIIQAINFLKSKGFIFKCEDGRYKLKDEIVISSDEVRSLAVRNYHRKALEQSLAALEDLPMEQREYGALVFRLPEAAQMELKQRIKDFRRDIHAWAIERGKELSEGDESTIIQLNFQMFPQTRRTNQ